jgi:hypothetical protein
MYENTFLRTMEIQQLYQKSIKFAAGKHAEIDQKIPGTNLPYVVHICNVSMGNPNGFGKDRRF